VDIIGTRCLHPVLVQLHQRTAKAPISGDGHHLWSWQEIKVRHEADFLRRCTGRIVRLINTAHIHLEALVHPPLLPSRLDKIAHDGALVCNRQASLTLEPLASMLDIELQDVDYLFHLLKIRFNRPMGGSLLDLLSWAIRTWVDSLRPAV
jgi:hypothetical protein